MRQGVTAGIDNITIRIMDRKHPASQRSHNILLESLRALYWKFFNTVLQIA